MNINFNDHVMVKLTEEGLKLMKKTHNEMLKRMTPEQAKLVGPFKEPTVDEQGYSTFQLWELMFYFGPHMYNLNPPIEADILIDTPDMNELGGRTR